MSATDKQPLAPQSPEADDLNYLLSEFDAKKWAAAFRRLNCASDEGTMLAWFASAIMTGHDHHARQQAVLVRDLDVALNGAPTGVSLVDLVAQVQARQPVQIVNFDDGMAINFRAPDGRRATLHMGALLGSSAFYAEPGVITTMRDAIVAYPSAGPRAGGDS